ncbi:acyl-CoA dehydrogenase family protein [Mycolicibacterium litorale]|uniref:acyl-CoA dehydrogenase family protein n=1 Tax=Mycolicibacterium litorale TaxID=758802 RepID=UPI001E4E7530|nr:acyl-CoA dehydrogenase family protein [Mycolicibacterium litorale]
MNHPGAWGVSHDVTDIYSEHVRISPPPDPALLPDALRPIIEATLEEGERGRVAPEPLRNALRDSGALRMLTPREFGGTETPLTTVLGVYEGLGRIDASTGLLVWNANFGFIGALLSAAGAEHLWGTTPDPVFANSGKAGVIEVVDGGYELSGWFPIVTGIDAADWLIVCAVVSRNGTPELIDGVPDLRLCAVRTGDFTIEDTWDVSGTRATGSNNAMVESVFVPADLVTPPLHDPPRIDRRLYRGFIPHLVFAGCTAVALGVAQAAVDATVTLATRKAAATGCFLADEAHTQYAIAKADTALAASRALLFSSIETLQSLAELGRAVTIQHRAALRAAMTHAAEVSREALVGMYELAGSSALYRGHPLERTFRDGMAVLQHANHSRRFLQAAGRVHLGRDPGVPLF